MPQKVNAPDMRNTGSRYRDSWLSCGMGRSVRLRCSRASPAGGGPRPQNPRKDSSMRPMLLITATVMAAVLAMAQASNAQKDAGGKAKVGSEDSVKDDLAKLRGKWERKDQDGRTLGTKEVGDMKETITYFDDRGKVIGAHTVEFKLGRVGNIRLF